MDINTILWELRAERERINHAIAVLERMDSGKRRGRPPKWMKERNEADENGADLTPPKNRKPFSEETKKRMAEAQRKRWANERAAAAGQA